MKKLFFAVIVVLSLSACNSQSEVPKIAIGSIEKETLLSTYKPFMKHFENVSLTSEQVAEVKAWPDSISIDIYFGTWCPDSQREVPILLKALADNSKVAFNLIALDMHKSDPKGLAKKAKIGFTATFVVLKNNQEIGRVVERPKIDLITDLNQIIINNQ